MNWIAAFLALTLTTTPPGSTNAHRQPVPQWQQDKVFIQTTIDQQWQGNPKKLDWLHGDGDLDDKAEQESQLLAGLHPHPFIPYYKEYEPLTRYHAILSGKPAWSRWLETFFNRHRRQVLYQWKLSGYGFSHTDSGKTIATLLFSAKGYPVPPPPTRFDRQMMSALNSFRQSRSRYPLALHPGLCQIAVQKIRRDSPPIGGWRNQIYRTFPNQYYVEIDGKIRGSAEETAGGLAASLKNRGTLLGNWHQVGIGLSHGRYALIFCLGNRP